MNSHYLEIYLSYRKSRLLPMLLSPNNKKKFLNMDKLIEKDGGILNKFHLVAYKLVN